MKIDQTLKGYEYIPREARRKLIYARWLGVATDNEGNTGALAVMRGDSPGRWYMLHLGAGKVITVDKAGIEAVLTSFVAGPKVRVSSVMLSLDDATIDICAVLGEGNISLGVRKLIATLPPRPPMATLPPEPPRRGVSSTLTDACLTIARAAGDGNISEGIRKAARLYEYARALDQAISLTNAPSDER